MFSCLLSFHMLCFVFPLNGLAQIHLSYEIFIIVLFTLILNASSEI